MFGNFSRGTIQGQASSAGKSSRKSGRRQAPARALRPSKPFLPPVHFLGESNADYSDTSMDQSVVQDLFNAVAALESGEESDVRRQLSGLAVLSGGESDGKKRVGCPMRRKILRQKGRHLRKKRRPRRKLLCVHSADEGSVVRDDSAAIARPRHHHAAHSSRLGVPSSCSAHVVGPTVAHTSSEDDGPSALLRLLVSDDSNGGGGGRRDSELSSVCVTESELSDTPWEESCDADDELSCFESTSAARSSHLQLRAAVASAARAASRHCYGDVEDAYEVDTGASDQDGRQALAASGTEMEVPTACSVSCSATSPIVSVSVLALGASGPACLLAAGASPLPTSSLVSCSVSRSRRGVAAATLAGQLLPPPPDIGRLTSSTSSVGGGNAERAACASAGADGRVWCAASHFPIANSSVVNGLRTLNRVLVHFINGRQRYLRLPAMHRRARRVVWRLASLYQLEWTVESGSARPHESTLTCTKKSRVPDASLVEQFIVEAAQLLSKPARSSGILERLPFASGSQSPLLGLHQSLRFNMQYPLESEEMEADETSATDAPDAVPPSADDLSKHGMC